MAVMLCGWEGNRIDLASHCMTMRYRHSDTHLRAQWPGKGRLAPRLAPLEYYGIFILLPLLSHTFVPRTGWPKETAPLRRS